MSRLSPFEIQFRRESVENRHRDYELIRASDNLLPHLFIIHHREKVPALSGELPNRASYGFAMLAADDSAVDHVSVDQLLDVFQHQSRVGTMMMNIEKYAVNTGHVSLPQDRSKDFCVSTHVERLELRVKESAL
jgi:hypothetical protein